MCMYVCVYIYIYICLYIKHLHVEPTPSEKTTTAWNTAVLDLTARHA